MRRMLLLVPLLVVGCTGPLAPVVNVSEQPLAVQQATHHVAVVPRSTLAGVDVQHVAHVVSLSCQNKLWDPVPTLNDALDQLRFWALSYSADAVTDVACTEYGTSTHPNCWESIRCSGTAVKVSREVAAR
jgi:hypothetical protein